jgi:hypothetical protein
MADTIEAGEGIVGNFVRRRRIEAETEASRSVGRTKPRERETSPGSATWNKSNATDRLVDEKG